MTTSDGRDTGQAAQLVWFKSSHSGSNGGDCVEVAPCPHTVHVWDSKDTDRPHVRVSPGSWDAFLAFATR